MFGPKQLYLVPSSLIILLLSLPRDITASITNSNGNSPSVRATHSFIFSSQEHDSYGAEKGDVMNSNMGLLVSLPKRHALAFIPRGGGGNHYDDYDYDSYDDMSDPEPPPRPPPSRRRPPPKRSPPPRSRNGQSQSRQQHSNRPTSMSRSRSNAGRRKPQKQNDGALTQAKNLTQKSISLATSATVSTLKTGGKAAYYLTAPKFVTRREVCGVWRLDQSIGSAACAANIEFTPQGDAVTKYEGEENSNGYLFQSRSWPRSCTIEFEAEAFQGPGDEVPMRYYYKGSFRRKVADKSVIKIRGKIYEVKKGRFGRGSGRGLEVGSFVARRRITAKDRNRADDGDGGDDGFEGDYDNEYDDDEGGYDDDDDEYDDDEY